MHCALSIYPHTDNGLNQAMMIAKLAEPSHNAQYQHNVPSVQPLFIFRCMHRTSYCMWHTAYQQSSTILYSWKLSREKTFVNFMVLWLFTNVFSVKSEGGVLWHGTSEQSAKVFSAKIVFFTNLQKCFSLKSFPLYALLQN